MASCLIGDRLGVVTLPPTSLAVGGVTVDAFHSVSVVAFAGFGVEGRCRFHMPVVAGAAAVVVSRSGSCLVGVELFALAFAGIVSIVGGGRGLGASLLLVVTLLPIGGVQVMPVIDTWHLILAYRLLLWTGAAGCLDGFLRLAAIIIWPNQSRIIGTCSSLLMQMLQLIRMLLALALGGCNVHLYKHVFLSAYAKNRHSAKDFVVIDFGLCTHSLTL